MVNAFVTYFFTKHATQKMKFSIKNFVSKCDQILRFLENFIFCAVTLKPMQAMASEQYPN